MKSENKVKTKQSNMTMKFTMKKFHLVSKYANYLTWDEKQNAPLNFAFNKVFYFFDVVI